MTQLEQTLESHIVTPAPSSPLVPLAIGTGVVALFAVYLSAAIGPRQMTLFAIGLAAGLVLYHAAFGFTSSWRIFIADRRGAGLRAQMLMLAATCIVFTPLLAAGEAFGQPLRGLVASVGIDVAVGAFMFGIGMQLGGGCASGTLYTVGGGNTRMLVTLLAFIAGSTIATAHTQWWSALPAFTAVTLQQLYGPAIALVMNLLVFAAIAGVTVLVERRAHGSTAVQAQTVRTGWERWLRGPWPLVAGALGLATVNIATLLVAGRPWGVTSAFALWGAKVLAAIGVPIASWPYWTAPAQAAALQRNVFADITTVMDIGIVLGALLAAMLAGRFAPGWRASRRSIAAAVIGGLLLGYGARIAHGCNIGAYFSGIASGSLHGWLWLVAAFAGNVLGVRLRPLCDLPVERSTPSP
jgi:uncharacterized protein